MWLIKYYMAKFESAYHTKAILSIFPHIVSNYNTLGVVNNASQY